MRSEIWLLDENSEILKLLLMSIMQTRVCGHSGKLSLKLFNAKNEQMSLRDFVNRVTAMHTVPS